MDEACALPVARKDEMDNEFNGFLTRWNSGGVFCLGGSQGTIAALSSYSLVSTD
jgi:hypothetical protein